MKFYRPGRWTAEQILEEHQFINELLDADLPVVEVLAFNGTTRQCYKNYMFAVSPSLGGRPYEIDNQQQLESVGRFLGRMHSVACQQIFVQRPAINSNDYLDQPWQILTDCLLIPTELKPDFLAVLDRLIDELKYHPIDQQSWLILHGDCYPGNIRWHNGSLFVDFYDARNGPTVQDLWMLLQESWQEQRIRLDILLTAYNEVSHFEINELVLIEPLRAMRMIYFLAWVVRCWQDLRFPKSFPWMTDAGFWYQQQKLFTEQIQLLREPPLQLMSIY